jgi:hypothetical protein
MDLYKAIQQLHDEMRRLNQLIANLEEFQRSGTLPGENRRGRRFMNPEERRLVSSRMKEYWARKRGRI